MHQAALLCIMRGIKYLLIIAGRKFLKSMGSRYRGIGKRGRGISNYPLPSTVYCRNSNYPLPPNGYCRNSAFSVLLILFKFQSCDDQPKLCYAPLCNLWTCNLWTLLILWTHLWNLWTLPGENITKNIVLPKLIEHKNDTPFLWSGGNIGTVNY